MPELLDHFQAQQRALAQRMMSLFPPHPHAHNTLVALEGKTHIARKTRKSYQQTINHLLRTPIGGVRLQSLRPANVRDCYTLLSKSGLAPRSQRKAASLLTFALTEALQEEVISRNPALGIKVKTERVERKAEVWSREEVAGFLEVAKDDVLYPLFYLMLALGLRRGEALGLQWSNVDLAEGTVKIRAALTMPGDSDSPIIKAVKTPKSRRTLYLSADVVALLRQRWKRQQADRTLVGYRACLYHLARNASPPA